MEIFKILRSAETSRLIKDEVFDGSPDDLRDGFIHLSTEAQLSGTLEKHFSDQEGLFIAICDVDRLGESLKWEVSRGGDRFPHLYRALAVGDVQAILPIPNERHEWRPPLLVSQ